MRGKLVSCKFFFSQNIARKPESVSVFVEELVKETLCDEQRNVWLWLVEPRLD